jgi:hypothetical protein
MAFNVMTNIHLTISIYLCHFQAVSVWAEIKVDGWGLLKIKYASSLVKGYFFDADVV